MASLKALPCSNTLIHFFSEGRTRAFCREGSISFTADTNVNEDTLQILSYVPPNFYVLKEGHN